MSDLAISDVLRITQRFQRSANLERDFDDASALKGYVVTSPIRTELNRVANGLLPRSGQRAWRVTGDYGSGKSSFGLVLAHLLGGRTEQMPSELRRLVNFKKLGTVSPRMMPVLVTGSREPMAGAILRSLRAVLLSTHVRGRAPQLFAKVDEQIAAIVSGQISEDSVLDILTESASYVVQSGKATGLLLIIDELGKFLEYAALYPERQDIFLLQRLAEAASRSGKTPLFLVGLLHQGFNVYADSLSQPAQKEWEKVAGRFEEILFNQPLDQVATLVTHALNVQSDRIPKGLVRQAQQGMRVALEMGWYGAEKAKAELICSAERLYPLHPTILPVLVKLFSRFGQNERSLFSFLLSNEPFGLQEFSGREMKSGCFYRLHDLYDYARNTFGHRLNVQSYKSHWNQIDSMIESFPSDDEISLQILKTVGLLNLLDMQNLLASERAIISSVIDEGSAGSKKVKEKLDALHRRGVLFYRGAAGGFCLWPHTSVNLETAYAEALRGVDTSQRVTSQIQHFLETRPIVARRHYIQTGNLRHFTVRYLPISDLHKALQEPISSDGIIIVPLCETNDERKEALRFAHSNAMANRPEVLIAISRPFSNLAGLLHEAQRWQWILENTPELNSDRYSAEEVTRQIMASRQMLDRRVQSFTGLKQFSGRSELQWFRQASPLEIQDGRQLLAYLSQVCDEVFEQAPRILNELANRTELSSAASAARQRLVERMFKFSTLPLLGMEPTKKPPEMSIYLSVLQNAGLHGKFKGGYCLATPDSELDICNVRPALQHIQDVLERQPDKRINIAEVMSELRRPPFGVRDGIIPILLAAFTTINEQDLAFYENGAFLRHIDGFDFRRLMKNPEVFEIQFCRVAGVRSELFDRLLTILQLKSPNRKKFDLLDVVRPLCVFAAQLPANTHKTNRLSPHAIGVRTALVKAKEPIKLIFHELPQACGFDRFTMDVKPESKSIQGFVLTLKGALDELKASFPELQDRMKAVIGQAFDLTGPFTSVRDKISERAENVLLNVNEIHLKAFCLRLFDRALPDGEWLESLGSIICSMPPSKWKDEDEDLFRSELNQLAARFRRVESMTFKSRKPTAGQSAVRIAITQLDGSEIDEVIYTSEEQEKAVAKLESQFNAIFRKNKKIVFAAAARAIWTALGDDEEKVNV